MDLNNIFEHKYLELMLIIINLSNIDIGCSVENYKIK